MFVCWMSFFVNHKYIYIFIFIFKSTYSYSRDWIFFLFLQVFCFRSHTAADVPFGFIEVKYRADAGGQTGINFAKADGYVFMNR